MNPFCRLYISSSQTKPKILRSCPVLPQNIFRTPCFGLVSGPPATNWIPDLWNRVGTREWECSLRTIIFKGWSEMTILLLFKYQSKLYNCVLARKITIKTKAPVKLKLTGAPLLGLAKSIYYLIYQLYLILSAVFVRWTCAEAYIFVWLFYIFPAWYFS